ncbi:hypothetical protein BASA81_015492 [Batrachochytrium salamandrivorans]|nr:hypothetical protein BASA81_015492 [Batrachochytrium salamandrivorans]
MLPREEAGVLLVVLLALLAADGAMQEALLEVPEADPHGVVLEARAVLPLDQAQVVMIWSTASTSCRCRIHLWRMHGIEPNQT